MPEIISKIRFVQYGAPAPKGSRFQGVMTTESIIGFYDYTSRKDKAEESQKSGYTETGFLGYTSRGSQLRTYTHMGWLNKQNTRKFKDLIRSCFHTKGNLMWDTVISLEDYEVSADKKLNTADDYVAVVDKMLPAFFRYAGFDPSNMGYWMNYHSDKDHPHIHLIFFEKHQTVTRGILPQGSVNKFKALFIKEAALRKEFQKKYGIESKAFFKLVDRDRKQLLSCIKERDLSQLSDIQRLYAKLPKTGRLSYNSQPMAKYRFEIDHIIDHILALPEIAETYSLWLEKVQQLDQLQNDVAKDNVSTLKTTETQKLYALIGNTILQAFKDYRRELSTGKIKVPMENITKADDVVSLKVGQREMVLDQNMIVYHERMAEIDLSQDQYVFVNPKTKEQTILDREVVVAALKEQIKRDQRDQIPSHKRMHFSGYHSRQMRTVFPGRELNRVVQQAIAQQIKEKEHDLDVYLQANKKKRGSLCEIS